MTLKNGDRFTVYDAMEASGYFSTNPANPNSRNKDGQNLYIGPVKFPMMLYHPKGEERVSVPGTKERTPYGTVELFGEEREIISREVRTEAELVEAIAEGWHKHPALAIRAANETWRKERGLALKLVPPISAGSLIADLEERNRQLTELLEEAKRNQAELDETSVAFVPPSKASSNVAKAGLV
jgi:hypothetical protein